MSASTVVVFATSPAPGQLGYLKLRHRQHHRHHARVKDQIRDAKAPGCFL
ncbi:MAG: hypothetical protein WBZ37_30550 [Mycobacterium sp.]